MATSFLKCCGKFLQHYSTERRTVICRNWILSVRFIAIGSLFIHFAYRFFHPPEFYSVILIIFHIVISIALLNECRRSEHYHKTIEELDESISSHENENNRE